MATVEVFEVQESFLRVWNPFDLYCFVKKPDLTLVVSGFDDDGLQHFCCFRANENHTRELVVNFWAFFDYFRTFEGHFFHMGGKIDIPK